VTGKSAFTEEEWQAVLEAPSIAGMLVLTAQSGGSFRESFALAKAYAEARQQHGEGELLDEIVSAKPQFDRHRYGTTEALESQGPQRLQEALAALESKATPEEVEAYRGFVVSAARRVAEAHKEHGERIGPAEQAALDRIGASLGAGTEGAQDSSS
jgi:hypothetical protein